MPSEVGWRGRYRGEETHAVPSAGSGFQQAIRGRSLLARDRIRRALDRLHLRGRTFERCHQGIEGTTKGSDPGAEAGDAGAAAASIRCTEGVPEAVLRTADESVPRGIERCGRPSNYTGSR